MRATERLNLLEAIGTELQRRYTFSDIDAFLETFEIDTRDFGYGGSKRVYAKEVLRSVSEPLLLRIAGEIGVMGPNAATIEPPENWRNSNHLRLFISHISKDKAAATRLKESLASYAILGFVAHEDILPTKLWQDEIERGLWTMDALVAVCTPGFKDSVWTQQEVGFALGRGTKIISFKMGEDPAGFIGKHQALPRLKRSAEAIAVEINALLLEDLRTAEKLNAAQDALSKDMPF